jgi:hypothetical protein
LGKHQWSEMSTCEGKVLSFFLVITFPQNQNADSIIEKRITFYGFLGGK